MIDAVDTLLLEREALDRGLPASLVLSTLAHAAVLGVPILASLLLPRQPPIEILPGFAVALPRGGGGAPEPPSGPAPVPAAPQPEAPPQTLPPAPQPEPQKIAKPPKDEPRRGLPDPNAKKKRPEKAPAPRTGAGTPASAAGGRGTGTQVPGLSIGPPGPGTPEGTDVGGDWYLASVQQKIWMLWTQQVRAGHTLPIAVSFTILADGTVDDVRVIQPSGVTLLDLAAQRAIVSAAPFAPLPKHYGTTRYTIQALFRPTS